MRPLEWNLCRVTQDYYIYIYIHTKVVPLLLARQLCLMLALERLFVVATLQRRKETKNLLLACSLGPFIGFCVCLSISLSGHPLCCLLYAVVVG